MKKAISLKLLVLAMFLGIFAHGQDYSEKEYQTSKDPAVSFVLNVSPASYLIAPDMDGFSVETYSGGDYYSYSTEDRIEGFGLLTPCLKAGIGINTPVVLLDFLVGGGYAVSAAIHGGFVTGDAYCKFKTSKIFAIGLHAGVMNWTPKWDFADFAYSDPEDVTFSTVTGILVGPCLTVGTNANFTFSLDYFMGDSDVKTHNGYYASANNINFSGVMVNLGFLLRVP